jgi:DNA-binding NarL/FixJ family response regulator
MSRADTAEEARFQLRHSDVVLVGSSLPEAPELAAEIADNWPEIKMLVTGVEEDPEEIIRYIEAGAAGYLVREESAEKMVKKIEAAAEEQALVSPQMAASLMSHVATLTHLTRSPAHDAGTPAQCKELTPRQHEVLDLVRQELSNQEIANRLHIQVGTVKNHVHHILQKLDVHDRYEAAAAYGRWLQREGAREAYVTL